MAGERGYAPGRAARATEACPQRRDRAVVATAAPRAAGVDRAPRPRPRGNRAPGPQRATGTVIPCEGGGADATGQESRQTLIELIRRAHNRAWIMTRLDGAAAESSRHTKCDATSRPSS